MPTTSLSQERSAAHLAAPFLDLLPISGVSILVFNEGGQQSTIYSSDATSARLDEIQYDLGEGPVMDAFRSGETQQIADVAVDSRSDWPMFFDALSGLPVAAVIAVPLVMGAVCVGVAVCYRAHAGTFDHAQHETASALGRAIAGPALRTAIRLAHEGGEVDAMPLIELRREVHQATGMVLAQLETTATDAFVRMRGYAFASGLSVREVARQVTSRQLDFSALPE